jgi:hypothetical protein
VGSTREVGRFNRGRQYRPCSELAAHQETGNRYTSDIDWDCVPGASPGSLGLESDHTTRSLVGIVMSHRPSQLCPVPTVARITEIMVNGGTSPQGGGGDWIISVAYRLFQTTHTVDASISTISNVIYLRNSPCL